MRQSSQFASAKPRERGYVLLFLLLFVAILTIMAGVVAPEIAFRVKRDREEEMIHRGVQYSRAIRRYVKKFGRYPTRIEELENTNNIRFLRKRYKDPITNKEFKLLHVGEVQLMGGAGIAGAATLGMPVAGMNQQNLNTPNPATGPAAQDPNQKKPAAGTDENANPDDPNPASSSSNSSSGGDKLANTVFGGGPIVGVASTSKEKTIREFNNKNHYNQWQFIYDPGTDRGGLLNTPAQPPLQNAVPNVNGTAPGNTIGSPMQPAQQPTQPAPQQNPEPPLTPQQ